MTKTLISLKNVSVQYEQRRPIVQNISFDIKQGELISLIGLNGSGKSTLLHSIIGVVQPTQGNIERHTQKIGFIPQYHDLDTSFPLTVQELCELFGGKHYKKYLEKVGMRDYLYRQVNTLSGGQFQRIIIAVALSQKPELLLLDEPISGIDLVGQASFYELINTIMKEEDIAVVVVSHNIHLVLKHSTKVICLTNHICCTGTPQQITQQSDFLTAFGRHLTPYIHHHDHKH